MKNKIFSLLVLLMTAATGAWAQDYYLVGTMNDWGASKQFQLTQNPDNLAEYMITLTFKAGAEFKVIGVDGEGNWTWFPAGDNYYVNNAGEYTVYFRPDYLGGDDWHEHCIYAAATPAPAVSVTDLGNNTWQFTMPDYAVVANIEYDTDLELREENVNTTVLADWNGYEANVTLKRTLTAGMWNTLAVPFDVSAATIAIINASLAPNKMVIKKLTSSALDNGTLTLNFEDASEMEAGKPYLVKVPTAFSFDATPFAGIIMSNATVPTETTYADFIPTLGLTEVTGDVKNIFFLAADNKLLHPSAENQSIKGFRAYFQLKGDAASAPSLSFALNLGDGETTSIKEEVIVNSEKFATAAEWFDLQGRRVNGTAQKGVYIVNGKKIIK